MLAVPQRSGVAKVCAGAVEKCYRDKMLRGLDEAAMTRYYWGLATKVVAD